MSELKLKASLGWQVQWGEREKTAGRLASAVMRGSDHNNVACGFNHIRKMACHSLVFLCLWARKSEVAVMIYSIDTPFGEPPYCQLHVGSVNNSVKSFGQGKRTTFLLGLSLELWRHPYWTSCVKPRRSPCFLHFLHFPSKKLRNTRTMIIHRATRLCRAGSTVQNASDTALCMYPGQKRNVQVNLHDSCLEFWLCSRRLLPHLCLFRYCFFSLRAV